MKTITRTHPHTNTQAPLLACIIAPRHPNRHPVALEAAMHSLALDEQHPVALEIAGTPTSKQFFLRATTAQSLAHAQAQLRARYPQAGMVPVTAADDPLRLAPNETVSAVELTAGRASYLPLRTWQEHEMEQEGIDPLLGVLAALDDLPEGMRVVAQIGMVPASPIWSQADQRRAVEHPLEPERARERVHLAQARTQAGGPSTVTLIGMALLLAAFLLVQHARQAIPSWIVDVLLAILRGSDPHLSLAHLLWLIGWGGGSLLGLGAAFVLFSLLRHQMQRRPIYDQKLVTQKTMHMAYRVRLRLYVITPSVLPSDRVAMVRQVAKLLYSMSSQYLVQVRRVWSATYALPSKKARTLLLWHWHQGCHILTISTQQACLLIETGWSTSRLRQARLLQLVAAYRQFHLASGNYLVKRRLAPWSARWLLLPPQGMARPLGGWWRGIRHSPHYIGVDTLAVLWHLPHGSALSTLTLLEQRRTHSIPLPPTLLSAARDRPIIGYAEHAGRTLPFALPLSCLEVHTLIGGKSGEGKSTCLEHLAREVMEQGSGLLLIDPHGDLSERVLALVPSQRVDDVVLIDLADPTHSVGINPLDTTLGRGRDKAVADLLHTLSHIWISSWGPRMENAFEMALRTLYEANKVLVTQDAHNGPHQQYTLLDVLPLLTDESFLHSLLAQISDPFLHRWWLSYYEPLSLTQQRDIINPVISKTTKFESEIARRIVGQSCSTINFSQAIQDHKIILVKLAKGEVGSDVAPLLGAAILGLVQITLEEQGRVEAHTRIRLPIIIDEFHVLDGTDYGALAELRKYGATFFLATQSLAFLKALNPTLLATVLANVKNFFIYHMSAEDATTLARELGVEPDDITTLEPHLCYVRLTYQQQRQPTFSVKFVLPPPGNTAQAQSIRLQSQQRYGRPVAEVDEQLRHALARTIALSTVSRTNEALAASNASSVEPPETSTPTPTAKKKRNGEWVKGGKKNQKPQPTPSAFAERQLAGKGEETTIPNKNEQQESEETHEPAN